MKLGKYDDAEQVPLDNDWVFENTDKTMQKFLKDVRDKDGHCGFVHIPEGDNEPHAPGKVEFQENSPIVTYLRRKLQTNYDDVSWIVLHLDLHTSGMSD